MAAKGREKIRLVSTGVDELGNLTGTFRTTSKNKRKPGASEKKLIFKKYDPRAYKDGKKGCHVDFKEEKMK